MLRTVFYNYYRRNYSLSSVRRNLEKVKPKQELKTNEPTSNNSKTEQLIDFKPNDFEKFILVWSGKYKSKKDIPDRISFSHLENAKSRFRIRASNVLMILCLALCGYYVYVGKKRQKLGDTITKRELERDARIIAEHKKSLEK